MSVLCFPAFSSFILLRDHGWRAITTGRFSNERRAASRNFSSIRLTCCHLIFIFCAILRTAFFRSTRKYFSVFYTYLIDIYFTDFVIQVCLPHEKKSFLVKPRIECKFVVISNFVHHLFLIFQNLYFVSETLLISDDILQNWNQTAQHFLYKYL